MKKVNKLIVAALVSTSISYAQQYPIYNMQFLNQSLYNPSTIGIGNQINTMLVQKTYLTGIDGNPNTLYFNVDGPAIEDKLGVGLGVYNDNLGITNKLGVYGTSAYRAKFEKNHYLDFGLSLGMLQFSIDPDKVEIENANDPLLTNKKFKSSTIDGLVGVNYTNKNIVVGLGVNQIFGTKTTLAQDVNFNLERSFIASAKYTLYVNSKKDLSFSPMIVARFAGTPAPQEAFLIVNYKDVVYFAPSYKSTGAVSFSLAANVFNGFKVGYSYDFLTKEPVNAYQTGGHEIMVGYSFNTRSTSNKKLDEKIKRLDEKLEDFEIRQNKKDKLQDERLDSQEDSIKKLDENIKQTQKELEDLKQELRDAGILKEENATDFKDNAEKGYYIVIASVKDKNISEARMKSDYLDRGFKRLYNAKTGWHYAYKSRYNDFNLALKDLRETRKGEFNDAWIHVLK